MTQQSRTAVFSVKILAFDLVPEMWHIVQKQLVSLCLTHRGEEVQPDLFMERFQVSIYIG